MVIIKESYAAYENQVEEPNQDGQGNVGLLDATATKWKNVAVNNMFQFFKMQLFPAALPGNLRKAVTQHNQNTIGTIFKATSATSFNKMPSAKTILL